MKGSEISVAELGAIGEFISSIAVLITLIFLTLEMRRNSRLLIRSNARITASDSAKSLSELLDKEVAEIIRVGCIDGMSVLDPPERYRFDLAFLCLARPSRAGFRGFSTWRLPGRSSGWIRERDIRISRNKGRSRMVGRAEGVVWARVSSGDRRPS